MTITKNAARQIRRMENMNKTLMLELKDQTHKYLEIWNNRLERIEIDIVIENI